MLARASGAPTEAYKRPLLRTHERGNVRTSTRVHVQTHVHAIDRMQCLLVHSTLHFWWLALIEYAIKQTRIRTA